MTQNIILIIYVLVFAIIATKVYCVATKYKEAMTALQCARMIMFLGMGEYFILSLIKLISYASIATLGESFWDADMADYFKYGVILLVYAMVCPFILKLIMKEKRMEFINIMVAVMFVFVSSVFVIRVSMSNRLFCSGFTIGIIGSIMLVFLKHEHMWYIKRNEVKSSVLDFLPCIFAWVVTVVLFLPNELFLTNFYQISGRYSQFLTITLVGGGNNMCHSSAIFSVCNIVYSI